MDFSTDSPDRAGCALTDLSNDVFGRAAVVSRLNDFPRHLGMDDDTHTRMLLADPRNLRDREAFVDRAMSFPKNHLRVAKLVHSSAAANLVWIPHDHLIERHTHPVRRV